MRALLLHSSFSRFLTYFSFLLAASIFLRFHQHTTSAMMATGNLYLPLDPTLVRLQKIKVGDEIKCILLEVRSSPEEKRKIWVIKFFQVHRHSRILYLPLTGLTVKQHNIKKGDVVKVQLLENRPAPRSDEEESTEDPGAL